MATAGKRSKIAMQCNIFAQNAGMALDRLVPGPNRDKLIARMFGVSVRMAQYLRNGKCWTVDRLSLAHAMFGDEFDEMLLPVRRIVEPMLPASTEEIHQRFDRLESELAALRQEIFGGTMTNESDQALHRLRAARHRHSDRMDRA